MPRTRTAPDPPFGWHPTAPGPLVSCFLRGKQQRGPECRVTDRPESRRAIGWRMNSAGQRGLPWAHSRLGAGLAASLLAAALRTTGHEAAKLGGEVDRNR